MKGDVGIISHDIYADLFRRLGPQTGSHSEGPNVRYIAITPWAPLSSGLLIDSSWTILPVNLQESQGEENSKLPPSTVAFSPSSLALKSFVEALQAKSTAKGSMKEKSGVEIRLVDVEPLKLETVHVAVDGDALNKHDEVQRNFGGGFNRSSKMGNSANGKGKGKLPLRDIANESTMASGIESQEQRLTNATRRALALAIVVRQGDILPLPLPTHPITHVSLPPARITFCEPVCQGILTTDTDVVVSRVLHKNSANRASDGRVPRHTLRGMIADDDDDASNEQFYSAAEDDGAINGFAAISTAQHSDSASSAVEDSSGLSDDSLENIISMATPGIMVVPSGFKSSATAARPRPFGTNLTGFDTPGSVYSSFTVTSASKGPKREEVVFQTQSLLSKVPDDILHPRPVSDEDEEARVFVDIKMLLKIGCFSGDWVKVESTRKPLVGRQEQWGIDAFVDDIGLTNETRPVKIYGLPDLSSNTKPRNSNRGTTNRQSSMASGSTQEHPTATAWFSPILLINLKNPLYVKISPLLNTSQDKKSFGSKIDRPKTTNSSVPPVAREVTLSRILSPVSTERALQSGLMAALTHHFENKCRILRKGDLVPLALDVSILRMLNRPTTGPDADREIEELVSTTLDGTSQDNNIQDVAWFRVSQILDSADDKDVQSTSADYWDGITCIEPMITRTVQARNEQCKAPSISNNSWEYYLNVKAPPKLQYISKPYANFFRSLVKPSVTPLRRRLRELMAAATSPQALHLGMDPMVILLHSTQRNTGKARLTKCASADIGMHVFEIDAYELLTEGGPGGGDLKTEALIKARIDRAMSCGNNCTTVLIRHIEALTADRMTSALKEAAEEVRVLVATTTELDKVPEGVRSLFTHELEISAPDELEREGILEEIVEERSVLLAHDVDLGSVALKTAALVAGDLLDIVERAITAKQERLEALINKPTNQTEDSVRIIPRDLLVSGGENVRCVTKADFNLAVDAARKSFADSIGAPKIPNVSWEDVGGLESVKDAVIETIQLPLERPELFAKGMKKRSGILFYGPPGTGKTLLAKAIATEFSLNFFSVKGPELLNMYIGESEANVRRVFQRARDARPCVIFFDELDSVAPKRGNQGDSGGVMDRIVSQLLAELDGMSDGDEGRGGVFVIGATNRPDLLDQALLRPGRFDKMLYLGVSDSHEKQLTILNALTRKFTMHPNLSLQRVANSLPFTYTGADLYAICSDAMLKAITRQASSVDTKIKSLPGGPVSTAYFFDHLATKDDIAVMVTEDDFFAAQRELVGSVR